MVEQLRGRRIRGGGLALEVVRASALPILLLHLYRRNNTRNAPELSDFLGTSAIIDSQSLPLYLSLRSASAEGRDKLKSDTQAPLSRSYKCLAPERVCLRSCLPLGYVFFGTNAQPRWRREQRNYQGRCRGESYRLLRLGGRRVSVWPVVRRRPRFLR